MNHNELVEIAAKYLRELPCLSVLTESRGRWGRGECPDAWGYSTIIGGSVSVECKVTTHDFRRDREKSWAQRVGQCRYYMAEPGVIPRDELPRGYGLLLVTKGPEPGDVFVLEDVKASFDSDPCWEREREMLVRALAQHERAQHERHASSWMDDVANHVRETGEPVMLARVCRAAHDNGNKLSLTQLAKRFTAAVESGAYPDLSTWTDGGIRWVGVLAKEGVSS